VLAFAALTTRATKNTAGLKRPSILQPCAAVVDFALPKHSNGRSLMDKDRIVGAAKEAAGKVKEGVGKAVGNDRLTAEGKVEQVEGKVQNTYGKAKDAARDAADKAADALKGK
jgi:uncharacterized protein YjbJ (UPF0337 family)